MSAPRRPVSPEGTHRWSAPIVARVLPFALFIAFLLLADLASWLSPVEHVLDERWLTVGRGIAVGLLLVTFYGQYAELRGIRAVRARTWGLSLGTGVLVFAAWIALDQPWLRLGDAPAGFVPLRADGTLDVNLVALRLIGLAIVVPVMEELFWRSFLMRWLTNQSFLSVEPRLVSRSAFLITAGLFALAHDLWLAGLVAGVAYNWVYMRSGTVWAPVIAHGITNALLGAYILRTGIWHLW